MKIFKLQVDGFENDENYPIDYKLNGKFIEPFWTTDLISTVNSFSKVEVEGNDDFEKRIWFCEVPDYVFKMYSKEKDCDIIENFINHNFIELAYEFIQQKPYTCRQCTEEVEEGNFCCLGCAQEYYAEN